jgi:hypothetical protein
VSSGEIMILGKLLLTFGLLLGLPILDLYCLNREQRKARGETNDKRRR